MDGAHLDDLKVQLSLKDVEVAKLLSDFQTIKMEKEAEERLDAKVAEMMSNIEKTGATGN